VGLPPYTAPETVPESFLERERNNLAWAKQKWQELTKANQEITRLKSQVSQVACLQTIQVKEIKGQAIAFSGDGKTLAVCQNGQIQLWRLNNSIFFLEQQTDRELFSPEPFADTLEQLGQGTRLSNLSHKARSIALNYDGTRLASADQNLTIHLWEIGTDKPLRSLKTASFFVTAVAFKQDGSILASACPGIIQLWNYSNGKHDDLPNPDQSLSIDAMTFSPNGELLATTAKEKIHLWDSKSKKLLKSVPLEKQPIYALAFSPHQGNNLLACGTKDGQVILLDLTKEPPVSTIFSGHSQKVYFLAFSPDGQTLISGSSDGILKRWNVPVSSPVDNIPDDVTFEPSDLLPNYCNEAKFNVPPKQPLIPDDSITVKTLDELLKELDNLIGLGVVKSAIKEIIDNQKANQKLRKAGLVDSAFSTIGHMIFIGNPGTGKTTVARLIGQIFKALGVLPKGHFIETNRRDLVGEYIGETTQKTAKVVDSALGGVLFIDEVYALARSKSSNDFGREAIDTLVPMMENHRNQLVVILAGYSQEMTAFIDANPGLPSRISYTIDFPDYNGEELYQIFRQMYQKDKRICPKNVLEKVQENFDQIYQKRHANFGNGREVRNFYEKMCKRQGSRIASENSLSGQDLITFTPEDIPPPYRSTD
jgi:AAA+ superfamily predicted ATPase